jgi:hypothetical protein
MAMATYCGCQAFLAKLAKRGGTQPEMFTTSYGTVERALWHAYGVPEAARASFRARLGHAQKAGLFGPEKQPGRGRTLIYDADVVHRLQFYCEMAEFGVTPAEALDLIEKAWDRTICRIFDKAEWTLIHCEPGLDDIILHMGGVHMLLDGWAHTVPNVNSCPLRELPRMVRAWMEMNPDDPPPSNLPPRAMIVNLSARLRTFHAKFADSHMRDEEHASKSQDQPTASRTGRRARKGK